MAEMKRRDMLLNACDRCRTDVKISSCRGGSGDLLQYLRVGYRQYAILEHSQGCLMVRP